MLYLVGGAPRTGKSALAMAMLTTHGVPWLPTDVVRHILRPTMPEIDAIESGPNYIDGLAQLMHPIVEQLIELCLGQAPHYLIEGVEILPPHIEGYAARFGQLHSCFLGDSRASAATLRDYQGENPWHQDHTDPQLDGMATAIRERSARIEEQCRQLGLAYIDVGQSGFQGMIEQGLDVLVAGPTRSS
jgi:hypothetical protein